MLSLQKTIDALLRIYDKECKPYEQRKIVFWYDTDKTAKDEEIGLIRDRLAERSIKLHILHNNYFETKKLLEHDDTTSDYLIYTRDEEKVNCENWLLDIQLYSKQYRFENSRVSDIKAELGIDGFSLDKFLSQHYKFFQAKISYLKNFKEHWYSHSKPEDETTLLSIMIAVIAGSNQINGSQTVRKILLSSLNEEDNTLWKELEKFNLTDIFWTQTSRTFGFTIENPTLKKFFLSTIITHLAKNTSLPLKKYEPYINKKTNESDIFLSDWMSHSDDSPVFDEYCSQLIEENNAKLKSDLAVALKNKPIEDYLAAECPEIIEQTIIRNIASTLHDGGKDYETYLRLIETRKTKHYAKQTLYQNIYASLTNAIHLFALTDEIEENKITEKTLSDLCEAYTRKYYLLDTYYRKFYYHYQEAKEIPVLKDNLRSLVETTYNSITDKILINWINFIKADNKPTWEIDLKDKQKDFYNTYIAPYLKGDREKIVVIISDALRYEVAAELKEKISSELKGSVELNKLISTLPSATRFCMPSLLPNNTITWKNQALFVDGQNTDGIPNREKILQNTEIESVAIQLNDFAKLSRTEAREKLKGKRVIYLYHDIIDAYGEAYPTEDKIFKGCQETIEELKDAVRTLTNSLNISSIIITSDHGFIYQFDDLEKYDKISTSAFDETQIIDKSKRHIISLEKTDVENVHRFETAFAIENETKPAFIYIPYGNLRFKQKGGGCNYVHGGIAPQETIVPVLCYTHIRSDADLDRKGISHGKVGLDILTPTRKITTHTFKITIFQTESVTEKREAREVKAALYSKDGTRVSDEKLIKADKSSTDLNDRKTEIILTLNSNLKNGMYIFKLTDTDTKEINPDIIEENFELDILVDNDFDI